MDRKVTTVEVLRAIRDAHCVQGAERDVLEQLVLRGRHDKGFYCFPSYQQICRDRSLVESTVYRALKGLTAKDLVRSLKRSNRSNAYTVNVELLMGLAEQKRAEQAQTGFEPTSLDPDWVDTGDQDGDGFYAPWTEEEVMRVVVKHWGGHPTFQAPTWRSFLPSDVRRCIEIAGSNEMAGKLLDYIAREEAAVNAGITGARKLGSYLVHCFPEWVERFSQNFEIQGVEQ